MGRAQQPRLDPTDLHAAMHLQLTLTKVLGRGAFGTVYQVRGVARPAASQAKPVACFCTWEPGRCRCVQVHLAPVPLQRESAHTSLLDAVHSGPTVVL